MFDLDLRVVDRELDRVQVTLRIAPSTGPAPLEGVSIELTDADGAQLSPRLQLPLSGELSTPVATVVELRTHTGKPLPRDAQVLAKAWHGAEEVRHHCPAERCRGLETHVAGAAACFMLSERELAFPLDEDEARALLKRHPWIRNLRAAFQKDHGPEALPIDPEPNSQQIADELGLEGEEAEWLKELLDCDDDFC